MAILPAHVRLGPLRNMECHHFQGFTAHSNSGADELCSQMGRGWMFEVFRGCNGVDDVFASSSDFASFAR